MKKIQVNNIMSRYVFEDEEITQIQKYLDDEKSIKEIADIYSVSSQTINRLIKDNNLIRKISNSEILTFHKDGWEELESKICAEYIKGVVPLKTVADIFNIEKQAVTRILKRHNIRIYSLSELNRKYTIDDNYFCEINTDSKAYILGLLFSDGNISENGARIQISLQEDDRDILDKILSELKCDKPLYYRDYSNNSEYNRKNQYMLMIDNTTIHKDLINAGLLPNKSLVNEFPEKLDSKYYSAFIRGIFDGDGCLYHNDRANSNTITITGSKEICERIKDIISSELDINPRIHKAQNSIINDRNTRVLMFGGNKQVYKFLSWIYDNAEIYLDRKYNKYHSLYNINNSLSA